ncbi:MAG: ATP-dependent RNA helicase HrpA, partial [Acidimicrobiia bacterium]
MTRQDASTTTTSRNRRRRGRGRAEASGQPRPPRPPRPPVDPAELEARRQRRAASIPPLRYPAELPVVERRDELVAAIRDHQVIIVAGETGSGKSTQLPKLCLEAGRGLDGMIAHTQPRRIAARAVAERVADELGEDVGGIVGYAVRFTDKVSERTLVKVMTDGILLAEIQRDRQLRRYDTIIVDEAHERSLNIDFLLGYLTDLRRQRPDLKLIITSATIDTARFAAHFDDAPVIEVSGRTYPVELRYRPLEGDAEPDATDRDQTQAICDAVDELCDEGQGDVLVFLSGEREIRDAAEALRAQDRPNTEILPLYARLSMAEQHRVFASHRGRRIVLATNVAETSLTVPGIRGVIDTGTARISRYNRRTKVQRLPIEAISQASANQRAGRCGRVGPGVCIRLYSETDFATRPEFTEPEILRTNLASVILQMAALRLGDIASFPFIEPPDRRAIRDGITLLEELGALDPDLEGERGWLTPLGRRLARLPIDPRLGRMVLEAERLHCVREVLIITAALSIQDPRERPTGSEAAAAEQHRRFSGQAPDSDLLAYLHLWNHLREQQHELSSSAFRRLCRKEYLNFLRVREWQDLVAQLRQIANELGIRVNHDDAAPSEVHRALLSGLLSQIGLRDPERNEYLGARNARFVIAPGSVLQRKGPRWVMAAELVETNRLYARRVARIQPEWVERLAPHLVTYHYSDPQWSPARANTVALEKVTLFGLPLVAGRRVDFGRIDPSFARATFIRHALVEGDWDTRHRFVAHNRAVLDEVKARHDKLRRHVDPDDEALFRFYDARVGDEVTAGVHFDRWWNKARRHQPGLLDVRPEDLLGDGEPLADDPDAFPDAWRSGELALPLAYRFEPGDEADGVTVSIPIGVLNQVRPAEFEWSVPGLRLELVTVLVRALPKALRKELVPVPTHAAALLAELDPAA